MFSFCDTKTSVFWIILTRYCILMFFVCVGFGLLATVVTGKHSLTTKA